MQTIDQSIPDPATQAHRAYWHAYRAYHATPSADYPHRRHLARTCADQAQRIAASGSLDYPRAQYAMLARHWAHVTQ